jgi:hypothetical protein
MSIKEEKTEKLNILLKGESADKFKRIKAFLGLENDTEVIRILLTWYYNQHEKDLSGPPKTMWHLNLNSNGVLVWDPELHEAVQIQFKPNGILCIHCEKDDCKHIQFATSRSDIREVIRKRRKEGWKLPDL